MARANLRPFAKGHPKLPTSGRKKGSRNRKTKALREFFAEVRSSLEWQDSAKTRMGRGKAPHLETLMVRDELGDPTQKVSAEVTVKVVYDDIVTGTPVA